MFRLNNYKLIDIIWMFVAIEIRQMVIDWFINQ